MITIGIVISLAGNLNVLLLAASRVLFAMSEGGELPPQLQTIHARYRTPVVAVLGTGVVMLALTLSGTFIYLITISTISRLVTYMVTCSALAVLRRRPAAPKAAFRLPAGVWMAAVGVALGIWLLSNSNLKEARDTAVATAIGLCIYGLTQMPKRRAA
jgi:amino acid transporter